MIQTQQKAGKKKSVKQLFNKCILNWIKGIAWKLHAMDLTFIYFHFKETSFAAER